MVRGISCYSEGWKKKHAWLQQSILYNYSIDDGVPRSNPNRVLVADTVGRLVGWYVGMSVHPSVKFFISEQFLHYCSCPTIRDWIAMYPALFKEIGLFTYKRNMKSAWK